MGSSPSQGLISLFLGELHYTPSCDLSMRQEDLGRCRENRWEPEGCPAMHSHGGGKNERWFSVCQESVRPWLHPRTPGGSRRCFNRS